METLIDALIQLYEAQLTALRRGSGSMDSRSAAETLEGLRRSASHTIQVAAAAGLIDVDGGGARRSARAPILRRWSPSMSAETAEPTFSVDGTEAGAISCHLLFSHEGAGWSTSLTSRVVPRVGEQIRLDGKGTKTFKVEGVIQHLGNDSVTLYCSVERLNVLGTLEQHGFKKASLDEE